MFKSLKYFIFVIEQIKSNNNMAQYKRILLKLSGESLMGGKQYGIDEVSVGGVSLIRECLLTG